jgi:hypothetical protein
MHRASLPILLAATPAVQKLLGPDLPKVATLAVQAILKHRRGIEVAHQQIRYRKHQFAFSSRIGRHGDLILDMDVGDPALESRIIIEAELVRAERAQAEKHNGERERRPRRW